METPKEKKTAMTFRFSDTVKRMLEEMTKQGVISVSKTYLLQTLIIEEYSRRFEAKQKDRRKE